MGKVCQNLGMMRKKCHLCTFLVTTPTLSIYQFLDGEYQVQQFRGNDIIESLKFPELKLTAEQIFQAQR